jgi:PKD repeat protein
MLAGSDGLPDPATIVPFVTTGTASPVDIESGPGGDVFYVDYQHGTLRRLVYQNAGVAPTVVATATPTGGTSPLTVSFDGTGSSDPDGVPLTCSWDLDGDGTFGDSTEAAPTHTYTADGVYQVRLSVTDDRGLSAISQPCRSR